MQLFTDFWRDRRGAGSQALAVSAALIMVASVAASTALDKLTSGGKFGTIAFIDSRGSISIGQPLQTAGGTAPVFNSIDHSATGSINRPIILDPCTGKQK